jgi:hypothetical protein
MDVNNSWTEWTSLGPVLENALLSRIRAYAPAILPRSRAAEHRFVIITTGRTGSELLVSLLDSHPMIRCDGEILRDGRAFPNAYIQSRAAMAGVRGRRAFGFKLLLSHFRAPGGTIRGIGPAEEYPAVLHRLGYKVILLVRRNPVEQAMSYIMATERQFHYREGDTRAVDPISVDPVRLMAATWILESDTSVLNEIVGPVPHLTLTYEDDLLSPDSHQATVDRVCGYLGIETAVAHSRLVKAGPRRVSEQLANYGEIKTLLGATRYGPFLEDAA